MLDVLYHKNNKSFVDVCHGKFGRKVIYSNVDSITRDNVIEVLGKALPIHNQNRREIDYLHHYTMGDQPILYRKKDIRPDIKNDIVENHAFEIVRFQQAQTYAEPISYVSVNDDIGISKEIDKLNDYMRVADKHYYDVELGYWQSATGTSYRDTWSVPKSEVEDGEPCFGTDVIDPRYAFIIYSTKRGRKPLASVVKTEDEKGESYFIVTTKSTVFEIKKDKIISETLNGHGRITIVECPNNINRLSDVEVVISLTDAINKVSSNRVDGLEQFVQSFVKFINCEIDEDTFLRMCKIGALKVKTINPSTPASVDIVNSQLDQRDTQVSKEDLYKQILSILGMPERQERSGGDSGQAVYLRNGFNFAEMRTQLDEPVIVKAEKDFLRIVLNILKTKGQISKDLKVSDIEVKITRNKTDNMLVKAQSLVYLLEKGIHPRIAIKVCSLFGDPEKVFVESKPYLDALYKTAEELEKEKQEEIKREEEQQNQSNMSTHISAGNATRPGTEEEDDGQGKGEHSGQTYIKGYWVNR